MSQDEIKAAAHRLREYKARRARGEFSDDDFAYVKGYGQDALFKDCGCLADAYLAEHPEDDDEPVTEEWLKVCLSSTARKS